MPVAASPTVGFGTKADTLAALGDHLTTVITLQQVLLSWARWRDDRATCLGEVASRPWSRAPLIANAEDVNAFELPATHPNFITQGAAEGPVVDAAASPERMADAIVCIPNTDTGFGRLFARGIAGLVTAYGGVNSHMAIRAAELRLPAVIGAGESHYARWSRARLLRLDCVNRRVEEH